MKNCIISLGVGKSYPRFIDRLNSSLDANSYNGGRLLLKDYPNGCPSHQTSPYAFKVYMFKYAESLGYDNVLWVDSALAAIKPIDKVFDYIEENGWLLYYNGFACGEWCTDAALIKQGLSRDQAMEIPDFTACIMGFNLKNTTSQEFLRRWKEAADDGISFRGDWKNDRHQCSPDDRCKGHRHDQVVGSIIAHKMNMKRIHAGQGSFFSYNSPKLSTPEYDSVVLVNFGC